MPTLESLLSSLSNETEVANDLVTFDPSSKILVHTEPDLTPDSNVSFLQVPPDFNIFLMFNLTRHPEDIDGWEIALMSGGERFHALDGVFKRVLHIQYHMFVPSHLYTLLLALYLPVIALGVLFNLTIITTIMTTAKLRTDPRNSFIVALAFSDLSLCVFTSPLTLWYTLEGHWPLGGNTIYLCKVVKAGQEFPVFMSSFCIGAIACDRFRFIVQAHLKQMTANQGFLFSCLLFLVCCAFVSPIFIKTRMWHFQVLKKTYFCDLSWEEEAHSLYSLISSSFHFALNLVIVAILYALIYRRLRTRPPSNNEETNRRRRRSNILMAGITLSFFFFWTPFVVYNYIFDFHPHLMPERKSIVMIGYAMTLLWGMCTSLANPILYSVLNESFRGAVSRRLGAAAASCPLTRALGRSMSRRRQSRRRNNEQGAVGAAGGGGAASPSTAKWLSATTPPTGVTTLGAASAAAGEITPRRNTEIMSGDEIMQLSGNNGVHELKKLLAANTDGRGGGAGNRRDVGGDDDDGAAVELIQNPSANDGGSAHKSKNAASGCIETNL